MEKELDGNRDELDALLRKLYPKLTEEERKEAMERLDQYLLLAWEIREEARGRHDDGE